MALMMLSGDHNGVVSYHIGLGGSSGYANNKAATDDFSSVHSFFFVCSFNSPITIDFFPPFFRTARKLWYFSYLRALLQRALNGGMP